MMPAALQYMHAYIHTHTWMNNTNKELNVAMKGVNCNKLHARCEFFTAVKSSDSGLVGCDAV